MGMIKIITPGACQFDEPVAQMVKISSRGLVGDDMQDFVKRASVQFIDKIASLDRQPGEELVHLLAVGAREHYGPNRNGDGFSRKVCEEYHPTFKKYARWYRHHCNKDTSKGRGVIKLSAFNEKMQRIELLVALNGTKEAAHRNGGLVADDEMEKMAKGEDIPVSMACRVSHDVCSGCGNRARTTADYCDSSICKYGGLKENMAKVFEDGHILYADNPDPKFFDISAVFRPADRIAYTMGKVAAYDTLMKAASADAHPGGAALALQLGVTAPLWLTDDGPWSDNRVVGQLKVANELIQLENAVRDDKPEGVDRAFLASVQPPATDMLDVRERIKLSHVMAALSADNCMLPVQDFLFLLTGKPLEKTAEVAAIVADRLPGIYNRLADAPHLEQLLKSNPYLPQGMPPRRVRDWVSKHANAWSMDRDRITERLQLSVMRTPAPPRLRPLVKEAANTNAEALAREYALYQLAYLQSLPETADAQLTRSLVIRHNYTR